VLTWSSVRAWPRGVFYFRVEPSSARELSAKKITFLRAPLKPRKNGHVTPCKKTGSGDPWPAGWPRLCEPKLDFRLGPWDQPDHGPGFRVPNPRNFRGLFFPTHRSGPGIGPPSRVGSAGARCDAHVQNLNSSLNFPRSLYVNFFWILGLSGLACLVSLACSETPLSRPAPALARLPGYRPEIHGRSEPVFFVSLFFFSPPPLEPSNGPGSTGPPAPRPIPGAPRGGSPPAAGRPPRKRCSDADVPFGGGCLFPLSLARQ